MGSDYTVILVNGKRQSNHGDIYPNNFGGNQFNHIPPLDAIERIEIIRGPASTLYGADAIGGVINIITKKVGKDWAGSVTVGRSFQEDRHFGDETTLDFDLRGPLLADRLGIALRGSWYERDKSLPQYAPAVDPNGNTVPRALGFGGGGRTVDNTNQSLGLSLSFKPDARQSLTFDYDISRQEYDNTPFRDENGELVYPLGTLDGIESIWRATRGQVQPRVGYTAKQKFERDSWSLTHEGDWDFGRSYVSFAYVESNNNGRSMPFTVAERNELQQMYDGTGAYAGMSVAERRALAEATFLPRAKRTLQSNQYTLDAKFDIPLANLAGDHMLVTGAQIIRGELIDGVFGMEKNQTNGKQENNLWAVFVEDNWMPNDRLTLTGGLRYDNHQVFGGNLSPRVYGVYKLDPQWTLKGGVSTGYKAPKTTSLYDGITGFGGQGTSPMFGNPDLKPETSVNSEVAIYWDHPNRHYFNATLFHNSFKDKIASQPCGAGTGLDCSSTGEFASLGYANSTKTTNIDKAVIIGAELAGRVQLAPAWALRGNYTYTDSEQQSGVDEGLPLTNMAKHMANVTLDWQVQQDWSVFLSGEYRSKRYRGVEETTGNRLYWKGYNVWHLGSSYRINKHFTVTGRVNNLLDKDFTTYSTVFTPDGNGGYTATFIDDYNNKDKARSFWLSLNARF